MKARLMPSGRVRYETNGLDYASALITLAHAIAANDFRLAMDDDGPVLISGGRSIWARPGSRTISLGYGRSRTTYS